MAASSAASGAIMTVFGTGMATSTAGATTSALPTTLAGTTIQVKDSAGVTQTCPLYYASPTQVNLVVPSGTALGPATFTIQTASGSTAWTSVVVGSVAPGLFTANASGTGVGAITGVRLDASGQQTPVGIFTYDSTAKQYVATPISLGAATDQVYLSLYGTGIRGFSSLAGIAVTIGGVAVPVSGAAAQSQFTGMDQVNIGPLPRTLAGKGISNIVLTADSMTANTVTVSIQ